MHQILTIITFILFCNLTNSANVKKSKIEELEKENEDILKQLDVAVKDSLDSLKQAKKSEAVNIGIEMMNNISKMLNNSNNTDDNKKERNLEDVDARRDNINGRRQDLMKRGKIKLSLEELQALFKKDLSFSEKHAADAGAVDRMKDKVDQWMEQKRLEANRIKQYKEKRKDSILAGGNEKCPRYGLGKKRVKKGGKRRKPFYPCCRKCCKQSYMGCL